MILKKILIEDQKELYRHKNYLLSLGLKFDSVNKIYSNSEELDFNIEFELVEFLNNNSFVYKFIEEKIVDFKKQISAKYESFQIDDKNIFIQERKTNQKLYLNKYREE